MGEGTPGSRIGTAEVFIGFVSKSRQNSGIGQNPIKNLNALTDGFLGALEAAANGMKNDNSGAAKAALEKLKESSELLEGFMQLGALTISGNYAQSAGGSLFLEIGGLTAGTEFDRLLIGGSATLAGTLNLSLVNGFVPNLGATFPVLTFASRTGTFTTVTGTSIAAGKQVTAGYNAADVTLTVTP